MYLDERVHGSFLKDLIDMENRLMEVLWKNEDKATKRFNDLEKEIWAIKKKLPKKKSKK